MILEVDNLNIINKSITRKQAKAVHKDSLPPGGEWKTMNHHHIYVLNGQVVAGAVEGTKGAKKATKAQLKEHQATIDKASKKKTSSTKKKTPTKVTGTGRNIYEEPKTSSEPKAKKPTAKVKEEVPSTQAKSSPLLLTDGRAKITDSQNKVMDAFISSNQGDNVKWYQDHTDGNIFGVYGNGSKGIIVDTKGKISSYKPDGTSPSDYGFEEINRQSNSKKQIKPLSKEDAKRFVEEYNKRTSSEEPKAQKPAPTAEKSTATFKMSALTKDDMKNKTKEFAKYICDNTQDKAERDGFIQHMVAHGNSQYDKYTINFIESWNKASDNKYNSVVKEGLFNNLTSMQKYYNQFIDYQNSKTSEPVHKNEKPLYTSNKRGSDPQNKKESDTMSTSKKAKAPAKEATPESKELFSILDNRGYYFSDKDSLSAEDKAEHKTWKAVYDKVSKGDTKFTPKQKDYLASLLETYADNWNDKEALANTYNKITGKQLYVEPEAPKQEAKVPAKEDLTKIKTDDLHSRVNALEDKYEAEANKIYEPQMQELKSKEKDLKTQRDIVDRMRKSKKKEAELTRIKNELNENSKKQNELWTASRQHIDKYKDSDEYRERARRYEIGNREMDGDLLPDEETALDKKLGAKTFDPKTPEEYYYRHHGKNGYDKKAVAGTPIDLGHGIEGFIVHNNDHSEFTVHEAKSGHRIDSEYFRDDAGSPEERMRKVANKAKLRLRGIIHGDEYKEGVGADKFKQMVSATQKQTGLSPRYNADGSVKSDKTQKKAPKPKKVVEPYYIHNKTEGYKAVEGAKKVDLGHGFEGFAHRNEHGNYTISEARSGLAVLHGATGESLDSILGKAKASFDTHHAKYGEAIEKHIAERGLSPKYANEKKLEKVNENHYKYGDLNIKRDSTKGNSYYSVTDKGHIEGSSPEAVQKKIDKLGAKRKTYMSDEEYSKLANKNSDKSNEEVMPPF